MNYGSRQYQQTSDSMASPRSIEIAVLRETNRRMSEATDEVSRLTALNRNHRVWSAFVKDVGLSSNPLPSILKEDLLAVGLFAMDYSTLSITRSLPLEPLLDINEKMIEGLSQQASNAPTPQTRAGVTDLSNVSA